MPADQQALERNDHPPSQHTGIGLAMPLKKRKFFPQALIALVILVQPHVSQAASGVATSAYDGSCGACFSFNGGPGETTAYSGWEGQWVGGGLFLTTQAFAEYNPTMLTAELSTYISGRSWYDAGATSYSVINYTYSGPTKWLTLTAELTTVSEITGRTGAWSRATVELFYPESISELGGDEAVWYYPWYQGEYIPVPPDDSISLELAPYYSDAGVATSTTGGFYMYLRDGDSFSIRSTLLSYKALDARSTLSLRFSSTDGLQASLVPEPSTWATFLAGMGILAAHAQRRRRIRA